jgi:hypothetical protein
MKTLTLLFLIFITLVVVRARHPRRKVAAASASAGYTQPAPTVCVAWPHALVRCGVSSSEDFEAQRSEPLLREHYSEVGIVQPAVLTTDRWYFASFRSGAGIVWTPTRILVRAGEHVLRDRDGNTIRARCGNRLSEESRTPVAFVMPPEMKQETAEVTFIEPPLLIGWSGKQEDLLVSPLPPMLPLTAAPTAAPVPETITMPRATLPVATLTPPLGAPPVAVGQAPEPHTFFLMLGAGVALWIARRRLLRFPVVG